MPWRPPAIDWLSLRTVQDYEDAISTLLSSNPVVNGSLARPMGYQGPAALYQAMKVVTEKGLPEILSVLGDEYADSQRIQEALMDKITKRLVLKHYLYQLTQCGPQPADCKIHAAQVWRPASFYVVRGGKIFDWERGSPQQDFYDDGITTGRRHPAIVTAVIKVGLYWMVPCSHSKASSTVAVKVRLKPDDEGYAICRLSFKASWLMLCGDAGAIERGELRVTNTDFAAIRKKISELLR